MSTIPKQLHIISNYYGPYLVLLDLADLQLLGRYNKGIRYLFMFANDAFSKYVWFIPLKDKKGKKITKLFQKTVKESNGIPNKIWVDKSGYFYNRLIKSGWSVLIFKFIQHRRKVNQ